MSDWEKKFEAEAKGLLAEVEEELTVLEGVDTIDPFGEDDPPAGDDDTKPVSD
ncbi:hypothetical protein [Rhodococcus sp. AQ5-07]|uniref:hypothetical protein n=1 Tax=Rhodococcus sp. AQ5-07 TaxID=2054902 RepID=UPI0018A754FC|nr:hypothetical protein [Rhodococcus sp. AQ5-07]